MTIVDNYITLLRAYNIRSVSEFSERFYQQMTYARFQDILKTYCVPPCDHRDKYVLAALEEMNETPGAREEILQEEREITAKTLGSPPCPTVICPDGRIEYIWPQTVEIAADMICLIDEHISRTTNSERLRFLRRRREKFERALAYSNDLSHPS